MGKTIVFANQKGGVGKTTTAVNIGSYMASEGKKILLVDFDPQGNLSSSVGCSHKQDGIYEVITSKRDIKDVIMETVQENLSIVTSNLNLSGATIELVDMEGREFILRKALDSVKDQFDYILIDCPPSLGVLTLNGFVAADYVIVPLQCEFFALEGFISMLFQTVKRIQQTVNKRLKIAGIVFTMYDSRTRLSNEVIHKVKATFSTHPEILFQTIIPRNIKLTEAPSHGVPINLYDNQCVGARSYHKLALEVIERV
ncbi:MAG: ParA family protein [Spirochaetaceae bacterium]|nr:ParA family protein [Spirochaetaceae bacterium]